MDRQQLELAIAAQEGLRGAIPDEIVDATVAMLRQQLSTSERDASQRRRQVTVLFADLSGFTEMSHSMDAEDVTGVMNAVWARLDEVVVSHGGVIDKHIGDALMAIWGAESTREDDPEQAVRAALGLHEALHEVASASGFELTMRVGVNTGPVLLGAVGSTGEITAMGDTVNVASRLEHAAARGEVLVAHATYRHVRGVFDVRPLEPLTVKGKADPLQVYVIAGVKPRAFRVPTRGVQGVETQMVGREAELRMLGNAFEATVTSQQASLATVIGEAGAGKSRLLYEFENWLELHSQSVYYLKGRALPQRRGVALALIRDVVGSRFEIVDSDPSDVVFTKIVDSTSAVLQPLEAALFGRWLGFDLGVHGQQTEALPGERLAVAGRAHLSALLRALAAEAPVVILLEDVHWADDDSLDVVGHLLTSLRSVPVLVVAASRPELIEARPDWDDRFPRATRVDLGALSMRQAGALVEEILQQADGVPPEVLELIVERAEGNPFYVEELVKMLIDDGIVEIHGPDGQWVIHSGQLETGRVPPTLTGVLQARLDALPDRARAGVQHASIIGRIFWDNAVTAVGGRETELGPAAAREMILHRSPSTFGACDEFIFKHALLHDVAYETVLLSDRTVLHSRAATWLEAMVGDRRDEFLVEIADHRRRAGDLSGAAGLLLAASEVAMRSGSPQLAREHVEQAVELWRAAGVAPPPGAFTSLARASRHLGDLLGGERAAQEAVAVARAAGDDELLVDALYEASRLAVSLGGEMVASELLDEALPIAEGLGGAALCRGLVRAAWATTESGDAAATVRIAQRALRIATSTADPELMMEARMVNAAAACALDDFDQARAHGQAAVEIARRSGDLVGEADFLLNLGVVWHLWGDSVGASGHYRQAEACYRSTLEVYRRLGLRGKQSNALANLAQVLVRLGDPRSALTLAREAVLLAVEMSALRDCLAGIVYHAEGLLALGDMASGLAHIGAVRHHPSLGALGHEIDGILARLDTSGTDARLEEHLARGEKLTLDDVVTQICAVNAQSPPRP
jgi:class 3 adenylate cyclase/tetratricopeptide (TPR) repeat protein